MTSLPALAVTGSTGALGGLVARGLADRGVAQRLVVRSPDRAPDLPGAQVVVADTDSATTRAVHYQVLCRQHHRAGNLGPSAGDGTLPLSDPI